MVVPDSDVIIQMPLDVVYQSSGFSLDIGGSVAKVVYRSNEEYTGGKPHDETQQETGVGQLHMATFARERTSDILVYLKEKCDVLKTTKFDSVFCCGVGSNEFVVGIEKDFGLKVINNWEVDEMAGVIPYLLKYHPDICYEKSEEGFTEAQPVIKLCMNRYNKEDGEKKWYYEGYGTVSLGKGREQGSSVQYPFCLAMMGSAMAFFTVYDSKGHYCHRDSIMSGGRFYMGVASYITKTTDYNCLQEMIDESSASYVEMLHKGTHLYRELQPDTYDGTGSECMKDGDASRGLLEGMCSVAAQCMHYAARVDKVRTVYCIGNFANPPIVKKWITKYITLKNAFVPKEEAVRVEFMRHGGFMGALGAYLHLYLEEQHAAGTI